LFAQIAGNSHVKEAKRVFYKRILRAFTQRSSINQANKDEDNQRETVKNSEIEIER